MDAITLLRKAEAAGLRVRLDGEKVKVSGPRISGSLIQELRTVKAEILTILQSATQVKTAPTTGRAPLKAAPSPAVSSPEFTALLQTLDADDRLRLEERAAALEFDGFEGDVSRADAEARAIAELEVATAHKSVTVLYFTGEMLVIPQDVPPIGWRPPF